MVIEDDGKRFIVETKPIFIQKFFAILFAILSVVFPLALVASFLAPPNEGTIDCDRARGTCDFAYTEGMIRAKSQQTVPIDAIERADVARDPRVKNAAARRLIVRTRAGETIPLTGPAYHGATIDGYRSTADKLNRFYGDPAQPSFATRVVANEPDWIMLVVNTLLVFFATWLFFAIWLTRRVVVDRTARTVRVTTTRKLRGTTDREVPFDEISELRVSGYRWLRIQMITSEGHDVLVQLPVSAANRQRARRILTTLAAELGRTPDVDDGTRRVWSLT